MVTYVALSGRRLRVLLLDHHPLYLHALGALVSAAGDMEVVAEASNARTTVAQIEDARPDVAVVALRLPGVDGISVARELRQKLPSCRVLILSGYCCTQDVASALRAGVVGFAEKKQDPDEILDAIRIVASGEKYVAPGHEEVLTDACGPRRRDLPMRSRCCRRGNRRSSNSSCAASRITR